MSEYLLTAKTYLPLPRRQVFEFFCDAANLGRITPPEMQFKILTSQPIAMKEGTVIDYSISLYGVPMKWQTLISRWNPPLEFIDEQLKGPYTQWIHHHIFREERDGETIINDEVRYRLPFGIAGRIVQPLVHRQLTRIFNYRKEAVENILLRKEHK